ncbi:MAG: hypothetical protein HW403_442 [Dehalococcoidia bacterium]|nr:hypothetical protein [Dehalococcoidia bacterium]
MPDGLITISNQPYLQTVLLHGHLVYPPSLLEEINNALSGLGKKSLSKRLLTFEWATKAQTGYRRYDLGIFTDREKDEDRLILTLFTGRARSASRKLLSEERHSEIRQVLAPMFSRTLGFDCNLAWSYPLDVATPLMNLPFELPVAVASELRSVRGLRVFNTDGTAWVILP